MDGNYTQDENGNWVPAKEMEMMCENENCKSTNGKDYVRKGEYSCEGWNDEPVYLCDEHGKGFELFITENKN